MKTICMLSDQHSLFDDRIYWKEAVSLKKSGYNLVHIGFDKKEVDYISDEGIRIISIKKRVFHSNIFIHKFLKTLTFDNPHKQMLEKAAEVKADAYHIHDLKVNRIGQKLLSLSWKPKVVYDIHEDYGDMIRYYHRKKFLAKWLLFIYAAFIDKLEKRRVRNYHCFLPVTPYIKDKFKKKLPGIPNQNIFNYTNLPAVKSDNKPEKEYDLIYTGLINWNRGAIEIISAVEIAVQQLPNLKILFLGPFCDSNFETQIRNICIKKKLAKNILFKKPVPYNKVKEYYKKARVSLAIFHPIKIFHYAIQIKTFEYMMYGLPLICSNFGYVQKFVDESNSGIAVDPFKADEISEAIIKLLTNTNLYNKYSKNGINAANNKYNWKFEEQKLNTVYKNLFNID